MTRLEQFRKLNPDKTVYTVHDKEFAQYGYLVDAGDISALVEAAEKYAPLPVDSFVYEASVPCLEKLPESRKLAELCWGCADIQVGLGRGNANSLDALEWHSCGETSVAISDMVFLVADRREIVDGWLDSSCVKAFYLAKGEIINLYATTLHYCPAEVDSNGLSCVVMLPRGTNGELSCPVDDPMLRACNKWIFVHKDCVELQRQGMVAGIDGENLTYKSIKL